MKKVLVYFSGKLHESRGTPIRTRNQIAELARNGFDVYYAGFDTPEGFSDHHVLVLKKPVPRFSQLSEYIRANGIDIVYMQTSAGIWYAPWLRITTRAKIGIDFHSRLLQEEHVYKKRAAAVTFILEAIEMCLARFLHFGTAVSGTIRDYYRGAVPTFLVLPVGVDTTLFTPETTPRSDVVNWKGDSALLGYAGNTKWYQGVGTVLEGFEAALRAQPGRFKFLVIASSGSEDVRTYVREHDIEDAVMVMDTQPHSDIPGLLAATDILTVVRPKDMVTEFSFPSKLPEYAAMGKALVVSLVSDISSYITDGKNGVIVPPDDGSAVGKALLALADPAVRAGMAREARKLAEERFDLHVLGKTLSDFLLSLR
jgi:glycosyltransferase involved in cell wall biosynthesis